MFSLPDLCVTRDFDKNHLVTRESEFEKNVIRDLRNEFDSWTAGLKLGGRTVARGD